MKYNIIASKFSLVRKATSTWRRSMPLRSRSSSHRWANGNPASNPYSMRMSHLPCASPDTGRWRADCRCLHTLALARQCRWAISTSVFLRGPQSATGFSGRLFWLKSERPCESLSKILQKSPSMNRLRNKSRRRSFVMNWKRVLLIFKPGVYRLRGLFPYWRNIRFLKRQENR